MDLNGPPPALTENQLTPDELRRYHPRNWRLAGLDFARRQLGLVARPASRLDVLRGMTAELVLAQPAPKGRRS